MTAANEKLKVLAVHGYRQSDVSFRAKLGALRKAFKREIDFTFVKAPHEVPPASDDKIENGYGWWFNTNDRTFKATVASDLSVGFKESVDFIEEIFERSGPFDGVLGFSQGAAFVSILCSMQQKKQSPLKFNFTIIVSGFKSLCAPHASYYEEKINLPSLHVYGQTDQVIPAELAEELAESFVDAKRVKHDGGHYVPGKKSIYNEFIAEMLTLKNSIQSK